MCIRQTITDKIISIMETGGAVGTSRWTPSAGQGSRADIRHGFDGAAYVPSKDQILLPTRERFTSAANYYATALHELIHWTGHESRLNRQFGKRFGDDAYAFEELVAELGAAFAVGQLGMVDATIENHAAYISSWVQPSSCRS